jgi:tetratricopeptide (TPR) repeat protein
MSQARGAWASSSQALSLQADLERFEGALLHDLRKLDGAALCFRSAAEIYDALGDSESRASALISEGMALREAGNSQKAVVAFYQALTAIDENADDKLRISALQCLCRGLCDIGKYEHAHLLSRQCSRLFFSSREPGIAIRIDFLNAQIDEGLGHRLAAEHGYQRCREWFTAAGMLCERALATLHLAALLADEGRTSEVFELCNEVSEIFDTVGVARESIAATLLREATMAPKAELLKAALHYMERDIHRINRKPAG